jgi:hypothetical protein
VLAINAVVELVWRDETGSTSATVLNTPSSLTVDEIDANATAFASILASLTNAVLVTQRIKYKTAFEVPTPPTSSTPINEGAVFIFATDEVTPMALCFIPAVKDSIMRSSGFGAGFIVDTSLSEVTNFVDACLALPLCSPFADEALALESAYRQSRV